MWMLLIPLVFAILHFKTGKYPFSAAVTLSCLAVSLYFRASMPILAAYGLSVIGDWFMAHSGGKNGDKMLLGGIVFFFSAHVCFLIFAGGEAGPVLLIPLRAAAVTILAAGYAVFLIRTLYPAIRERFLKIAATAYTGISLTVMGASLFSAAPPLPAVLFAAGIALILFSDTLIALSRFLGQKRWNRWICPTYFACHILVAASQILMPPR